MSAARTLADAIKRESPGAQIELVNGFGGGNHLGKMLFEKNYNFACNYVHGLFPLLYDLGETKFFQNLLLRLLYRKTTKYLRGVFSKKRATDVVSFHFALTPFAKAARAEIPWKINLTTIVTDPFTVPKSWFHERDTDFFVYSQEAKDTAVKLCAVPERNVMIVPFLMNPKYMSPPPSPEEVARLKEKHGFDPRKKIVLMVGGGEGLPGAVEIINECIIHRAPFAVAMVCGRAKPFKKTLDILSATYPKFDLHVFGFIDCLDELMRICDCAVVKAGPAVLMEALSCRKPVIIIKYIYNQELGNMRYATRNHVGYYIRRPRRIYRKIKELLDDTGFEERMGKNFDSLNLDVDSSKTARLLLQK